MEHKEAGNQLFKQQKWAEAIGAYSLGLQAIEDLPADTRGLLLSNRSQCHLNLEDWARAFEDADACLALLPEHAKSLFRRASASEKLGRESDALADYVRVVKADPQNKAAVLAAQRLREKVMQAQQQKVDERLPTHLFDVLRAPCSDATVEKQVDAAARIQAYCVRRGMAGSLLSSGVVELFVERASSDDALPELRASLLSTLVAIASGAEAGDGDEAGYQRPPPNPNRPLEVAPATADARSRLRRLLRGQEMRRLCRPSAGATRHFATLLGFTHELEDLEALEAIHDAVAWTEGGEADVPRAGILALASMCDRRRRLGNQAQPLMPSAVVLKCMESALGVTTCEEQLKCLLASVFVLLGDEERGKGQEVDLAELSLKMLEPFLQSQDFALKSNGLAGLSTLFAASPKAASKVLQSSQVPFMAILVAIQRPPPGREGREAQSNAVECLFLATGEQKTRQSLVECGGVDIILTALSDGEEGSSGLMRAKLVAVLAIIAGHNKDVREEIFDRMDFLLELRHALDTAREGSAQARGGKIGAPSVEESRRLFRALYESIACLTIHGEFKESLQASKKTLKAIQDLPSAKDLLEDTNLAFQFTTIVYNLCRSREDKTRPKKKEFPFNELTDDDLNAIEQFYDKMPAEARPVKNGEIDSGSKELADQFRSWCVLQSGDMTKRLPDGTATTGSNMISHLGKCVAHGSMRVKTIAAMTLKYLCAEQSHRRYIVSSGGVRTLLALVDVDDETARDAARQALAQICISTNPVLLPYSEQLDAVRPLVETLEHNHELLQFEAAMGLTNLLTASDELRSRAVQGKAWSSCRDLLFSDNERVQRAGLEAMCNLTMAPEILERFAEGKCPLEIKVFISFSSSEDKGSAVASSGALAMLASCDEVAVQIAAHESFGGLLDALLEVADPVVQHRLACAVCAVLAAEGLPEQAAAKTRAALSKRNALGFCSKDAELCV
eukprot:CAMPEP_0198561148 /NCGR_PEP_ID=MMETSP1462-20131121/94978_1 /TAXON_ID=1333877 /ORGANISM="Brandtodinium nutriculum, Strain RCC3387" /LENGTH=960 /DNA_ID=CAMNT_0044292039 /DNA_START=57 /DNA_END=2936 /DNA_ORIENTATION=+